jgi:hypothetical protein
MICRHRLIPLCTKSPYVQSRQELRRGRIETSDQKSKLRDGNRESLIGSQVTVLTPEIEDRSIPGNPSRKERHIYRLRLKRGSTNPKDRSCI